MRSWRCFEGKTCRSRPAVVCAYSSVGTAALEGLLEAGVEVQGLYTYAQGPDELWFSPPATVATPAQGIPVTMAPAFNDDAVYDAIRDLAPDFLFSFYFREMIQARFLELPRLGAYNLHGSLLPEYPGSGAHQLGAREGVSGKPASPSTP